MRFEAFERPFLVGSHQPRITRHIGGEDRGETAFDGLLHGTSPAAPIIAVTKCDRAKPSRNPMDILVKGGYLSISISSLRVL
jgi:hypothetical protein